MIRLLFLPSGLVRLLLCTADQVSQSISVLLHALDLPRDISQTVLAEAVQQHGTASSLRLTSRSLAHASGAALVTGEAARQAPTFPPSRGHSMLLCMPSSFRVSCCLHKTAGTTWNRQICIACPEECVSAGYGKWASSTAPSPLAPLRWTMWFAQHICTTSMTCSAAHSSGA